MEKMAAPPGIAQRAAPNIFQQNNGKGMPKRTFKDKMTIGKGADEVDLYYFGRGHTNGDAWVVFPALRFAHAGDIFSGKNLPLLDTNNGGSGVEIGATLAKAHARIKNVDSIITGHSTVMTWADLAEYAQFNKDFLAGRAGRREGRQDAGRHRGRLEDRREQVQGLQHPADARAEAERHGYRGGAEEIASASRSGPPPVADRRDGDRAGDGDELQPQHGRRHEPPVPVLRQVPHDVDRQRRVGPHHERQRGARRTGTA